MNSNLSVSPSIKTSVLAYAGLSSLYLALLFSPEYGGMAVLKVAPIALLFCLSQQHFQGTNRLVLSLALVFSGLGDALLTLNAAWAFPAGLGSFLIAQLFYAGLFLRSPIFQSKRLIVAIALIIHALYFARVLLPEAGELAPAIIAYASAIALMGLAAVFYKYNYWVLLGALTFIVSDTLIGFNKFIQVLAWADFAIMSTYYLAQILIFYGLFKAQHTQQESSDV
jgi:uncharacterized membrane protein YhhN